MTRSKIALLCLGLGLFTVSCEQETAVEEMNLEVDSSVSSDAKAKGDELFRIEQDGKFPALSVQDRSMLSENLREMMINEAVEPSECAPTELAVVQSKYINALVQDTVALANYSLYLDINFIYSYYLEEGKQYFGPEGEYTQLMVKRQRELEKFWGMTDQIQVNGQHLATLNDREKLADVFEQFGVGVPSREVAYMIADELLALNEISPNLPENPFFATDGFASSNGTIVIGDGIVQWMTETGVDTEVVWTGILAHEWAHQVQFSNYNDWYPEGAADNLPEATRYTELEADFLAAYYMTHKRGATYNWKGVEQFYELFFQIGDCGFERDGHHGTPAQRMAAAQLGYELAESAQKKGHILSQQEAHEFFVANINTIL